MLKKNILISFWEILSQIYILYIGNIKFTLSTNKPYINTIMKRCCTFLLLVPVSVTQLHTKWRRMLIENTKDHVINFVRCPKIKPLYTNVHRLQTRVRFIKFTLNTRIIPKKPKNHTKKLYFNYFFFILTTLQDMKWIIYDCLFFRIPCLYWITRFFSCSNQPDFIESNRFVYLQFVGM